MPSESESGSEATLRVRTTFPQAASGLANMETF